MSQDMQCVFTFMHLADAFIQNIRPNSGYTFFISILMGKGVY